LKKVKINWRNLRMKLNREDLKGKTLSPNSDIENIVFLNDLKKPQNFRNHIIN